jgi:hypothetical protein
METEKLIDVLLFTVNEKANKANKMMYSTLSEPRKHFYHGQYMAFCEIYSLLNNMK